MNAEAILTWVRRRPFQPFRFWTTDGGHYDVRHPDQLVVGRVTLQVSTRDSPEGMEENADTVGLLHVTRIHPLST